MRRSVVRLSGLALLASGVLGACNAPIEALAPPTVQPTPSASTTPIPASFPDWKMPEHRIGIRTVDGAGEFFDRRTGESFIVRGANYVFVPMEGGRYSNLLLMVGVYDGERTPTDFANLAGLGYNTVRVFLDQCGSGTGCIGDVDNLGLNPAYLDNLADMLAAAEETGIVILFTSNDLPDQGGYSQEANTRAGDTFAGYRNSYYLTPEAITATRRYWRDLLTGLIERRAAFEAVLGWQLLNEQWMFEDQPPLSLAAGQVETTTGVYDMADPAEKQRMVAEGLIYYVAQMKEEILTHDPTALVTMGFFAPDIAAPGWYVQTAPLLAGSNLDFFDFHAYPGGPPLSEYPEHFGMVGYTAKPILLGEYGAFRHHYNTVEAAARAVANWVSESCSLGFDGWLYWTYWPASPEVGDRTWGLADEGGYLLDLFAPVNQPDPCVPLEVPGGNVAYGKSVRASAWLAAEPPENAVDESAGTQWGAGNHPPQWIEVDLGGIFRVTEVRLLVAQYPEGATLHRILIRGPGGLVQAHEFSGVTKEGDWLVFTPEAPLDGVQAVRIQTLSSPSWVAWAEVQIFGEAAP